MVADPLHILLLAPRGRDGELMQTLLQQHDLEAIVCPDSRAVVAAIDEGAGCLIVTQESLDRRLQSDLSLAFTAQPPWSDFPVLALVNEQTAEVAQLLAVELGNVTVLERPLAPHVLLTAVHAALRGRRRQYEARAAIQQRDEFLAMLGHELRNPLGAVVLASQLARTAPDAAQLERRLAMIERQSRLLGRLVDDLLDVARVTSGKVRLRREAIDIDETIRSCIAGLAERAREHAITVELEQTSGLVIEGDAVRLEQVVSNLLANAIKYSERERRVHIATEAVDGMCTIRIRDEGIGIAPEMKAHVFDLFAQAGGTIDRSEGGMGIGLTLVDRLVRLHGGQVEVLSEGLGHGSEVVVRLPIGNPPRDMLSSTAPIETAASLRVIIVEDNDDLRELARDLLEALGCAVETAVDGADGVAKIIAHPPDLALVDIGLPVMDGFAVAREVRRQLGDSVCLVAVSGYGLERDREEAKHAGFDRHVTKPLDMKALRDVLDLATQTRDRSSAAAAV